MKLITKITALALVMMTCFICLASCKKDDNIYGGDGEYLKYDPYDNLMKDPVDTGAQISVTGKTYVFKQIDIYNSNVEKQVTAEKALTKLYKNSKFKFTAENKVKFEEGAAYDYLFFSMPETEGTREENVLTVKHTNGDGYKYDVRFEIHKDKIYVIHVGHTYNQEGVYSTITFTKEA